MSIRAKAQSSWSTLVVEDRFAPDVQRFAEGAICVILSAQSPAITGDLVVRALASVTELSAGCPAARAWRPTSRRCGLPDRELSPTPDPASLNDTST